MVTHAISMSGGKDSTALALRLAEVEPQDYKFIIAPTGNELPEMIAHWKKISKLLGAPLTVVTSGKSLQGLIRQQRALPNHRQRWCTRMLKLEPLFAWQKSNAPCISYVGLRADESERNGMIFPSSHNIAVRFPLREWGWGIDDVMSYLERRGVSIPERTDCAACFWQRIGEWYLLWKNNRPQYDEAEELENGVQIARNDDYTFRSQHRDTWPAGLSDLRKEFEAGRIPDRSLKMMDTRREIGACRACTL